MLIAGLAVAFLAGLAAGWRLTAAWLGGERQAAQALAVAAERVAADATAETARWKALAAAAAERTEAESRAGRVLKTALDEALMRLGERANPGDGLALLEAEQATRKP